MTQGSHGNGVGRQPQPRKLGCAAAFESSTRVYGSISKTLPRVSLWVGCLGLGLGAAACDKKEEAAKTQPAPAAAAATAAEPESEEQKLLEQAKTLFQPLPAEAVHASNALTEAKINLGRILYYEQRLSKNHDLSCNSCHDLTSYGVDVREPPGARKTSKGHKGQLGDRNSPTVYNAALHFAQFWDGRAADVEEQAKGPILNPVEMAMPSEAAVIAVLKSIPGYAKLFQEAFPEDADPINYNNIGLAIGAFERKLMTPGPFDDYLNGNEKALSAAQQDGLRAFMEVGCITCHSGPLLGGNMYQKLGLLKPYPSEDEGRYRVTKNEGEKYFFKVPSLRNIAKTAPYLHDGSLAGLKETVAIMAEYQSTGGKQGDDKVQAIVAFLDSLTGTIPSQYIAKPEMPASGPKTPKPDPT